MSEEQKKPEWVFYYIWGLRGPEPQRRYADFKQAAPAPITKPIPLPEEHAKLTMSELVALYPPPADAKPPDQKPATDTKKPADEPALTPPTPQ